MRIQILTSLAAILLLTTNVFSQCATLSQTPGWTAAAGLSCPFVGAVTDDTHFYRVYNPSVHGIGSPVEVCAVEFPVWLTQSGDGVSGNCAVIRLWRDTNFDMFPGDIGNPQPLGVCGSAAPSGVLLLAEDYVYIPDSASGTTYRHEFNCASPLWDPLSPLNELIVEVYFKCPASTGGRIEIGVSNVPGFAPSFMQAATCGMPVPVFTNAAGLAGDVVIDVQVEIGGNTCASSNCLGPQMEHPGTNEDLMLVSANRGFLGFGPSTDMSDGHGGETEKPGTGNDIIELRFGSPCGTFIFSPYVLLATLHRPSGTATGCTACGPTVASVFNAGKLDIYAQVATPFGPPFLTAVADQGLLGPGCQSNRHWFLIDPILNGTGYEWLWQIYVFSGAAQNAGIASTNGHDFGPF